ncbi:MAG TPA: indole-3-glycerol phosphate synthase TrpC [Thermomicrobiales bacterium]|nr:indole-3-glycerol phosphate synthase TrpC [Thermomicrobiales bacterium]
MRHMGGVASGTVLDRIIKRTAEDLRERKRQTPRSELLERIARQPAPVDFERNLRRDRLAVIAEIKRASPSKGRFPVEIDPATVAQDYIGGGAAAISCLTDGPFFEGSLADLEAVVKRARATDPAVGVLRKDFTVDTYQIDEARAWGASCILLIVAALEDGLLRELFGYARHLGIDSLVEVHDEMELDRAVALGATLVGINNRNLKTLDVDLAATETLASLAPSDMTLVSESGISSVKDVERMADAGVDAILVGESLIVSSNRAEAVRALAGVPRRYRADA